MKGQFIMINPMQDFIVINGVRPETAEVPLAMAYIRRQEVLDTFPTQEGYCCGTIFRELYKPFMPEMRK